MQHFNFIENLFTLLLKNTHFLKTTGSVHDTFIRAILSDIALATDYFRSCLPANVSEKLDFASIVQLPDSYVSDDLQPTISDIVYSCALKNTKRQVRICLLVEHKSYRDKYSPVQIGGYIFSGLLKQLANKEELTLILPVLLYHGKGQWKYRKLSSLFEHIDPAWKSYLPDYDYIYHNLGEISDIEVEVLNNKFLAASLLALKHTFNREWLKANFGRLLNLLEEATDHQGRQLIVYLVERGEIREKEIIEIIEILPKQTKMKTMNAIDTIFARGVKKGHQEARMEQLMKIVRNLLKNTTFTDHEIASLAETTEDFVAQMREDLKKN